MKKVLSTMAMLLCIASMCVFTSCKDEEKQSNAELIIGTWKVDHVYYNGEELDNSQIESYWEFKEDGSANLIAIVMGVVLPIQYTYTIDDKNLVIYNDNEEHNMFFTATILQLDENTLDYEYIEEGADITRRHVCSRMVESNE